MVCKEVLIEYFYSGRQCNTILNRLEEVHHFKRRYFCSADSVLPETERSIISGSYFDDF